MSWWETLPTLAVALVVFFVPGMAVLRAAGLRGFAMVVLAVPVSSTIAAVSGILFGLTHVPFNPFTVALMTVMLVAVILGIRYALRHRGIARSTLSLRAVDHGVVPGGAAMRYLLPLAVLVPAIIIGARYLSGFGSPDSFSETYDNIYHLNAVRFIADTQSANTLTLGNLTEASQALYPAGMHAMLGLILMIGDPSITVVMNWGTVIYGALVWPMSCLFLITRVVGSRPMSLLATGVLSAGFSSFPYLMVGFGILYPNHAALTMLPAALGLLIEASGIRRPSIQLQGGALLALAAVVPGLALTHPSAFIALLYFGIPLAIGTYVRVLIRSRQGGVPPLTLVLWSAGVVLYGVITLGIWITARPPKSAANWPPFQTNAQAVGEVLTSAPMGTTVAWIISFATAVGLYVVARRIKTYWWTLGMFGLGGLLYLIVTAWPQGNFRFFMTGVWYSDSNRFAAMLPLVTIPIVALGVDWLIARLTPFLVRWTEALSSRKTTTAWNRTVAQLSTGLRGPRTATAVAAVVIIAIGVAGQGGTLSIVQQKITRTFETKTDSSLVTTDELRLMRELGNLVPAEDLIVGNPRTGASLAYAFSGRHVVAPHVVGARTPDEQILISHWAEAAYNPSVCPVIREHRAFWALDFADEEMAPRPEPLEGTRDLANDSAPGVELVKAYGKARLFRMSVCD